MPTVHPPQAAIEHDARQRQIATEVVEEIARQWAAAPPSDFDAWFGRNVDRLVRTVTQGQRSAVAGADRYVGDVLDEQNASARQVATPNPSRLVGVTSDGRTIDGLLRQAVIGAQQRVAEGEPAWRAWQSAGLDARLYIQTELADAGRAATGLGIVSRLGVGYVRMLVPPSCSRCVILAGRYYHFNRGFLRHPGCNCRHIPCKENRSDDVRTDPRAYFNQLTPAEQARTFTAAGARAIRDGADVGRVVNARRGLAIVGGRAQRREIGGRQVLTTSSGTTRPRRGQRRAPRLMPETIYEIARDREQAIELLRTHGYVL